MTTAQAPSAWRLALDSSTLLPTVVAAVLGMVLMLRWLPPRAMWRPPAPAALARAWEAPDADRSHLLRSGRIRSTLRGLRSRQQPDRRVIDLPASIRATAQAGGPPHLVMDDRAPVPEYLVVVEARTRRDQAGLLPEVLVRRLRAASLRLDAFVNVDDAGAVRPYDQRTAAPIPLGRLVPRHRRNRLLLVSDGGPWWDALSDALRPEAEPLLRLAPRVLLTPVPRQAWGAREACFTDAGFVVVELTFDGLDALARWLEAMGEQPVPERRPGFPMRDVAAEFELEASSLLSERPPSGDRVLAIRDQLAAWVGPAGWQLLAALALHPRPGAGLTARLASRLARERLDGDPAPLQVDEATLNRVVRLPWLRRGRFPGWLRDALAPALAPELRGAVADTYLRLLTGEDATPFRMGPADRAKLLRRSLGTSPPTNVAPDERLSAFLQAQSTALDVTWRERIDIWARAAAAPAASVAAALIAWILWQRLGPTLASLAQIQNGGGLWSWLVLVPTAPALIWLFGGAKWSSPPLAALGACIAAAGAWSLQLQPGSQAIALGALLAAIAQILRTAPVVPYCTWSDFGEDRLGCTILSIAALTWVIAFGSNVAETANLAALAIGLLALGAGLIGALPLVQPRTPSAWVVAAVVFAAGGLVILGSQDLWAEALAATQSHNDFNHAALVLNGYGELAIIGGALALTTSGWLEFEWPISGRLVILGGAVCLAPFFADVAFGHARTPLIGFPIPANLDGPTALRLLGTVLPARLVVLAWPRYGSSRSRLVPATIALLLLKTALFLLGILLGEAGDFTTVLGIAAEYAVAVWLLGAADALSLLPRAESVAPWLASLPLLLCSIQAGGFSLGLMAIPLAALIAARPGRDAMTPIAVMLAPMLFHVGLGPVSVGGNPGLFLAALTTASLAEDRRRFADVLRCGTSLRTSQVRTLFYALPWAVSLSIVVASFTTSLWSLVMLMLTLIGLSRIPLDPFRRPWMIACGAGLVIAQLPLSLGSVAIGFGFDAPSDVLGIGLALWGARALRTPLEGAGSDGPNLARYAFPIFCAAVLGRMLHLAEPLAWGSFVSDVDLVMLAFGIGVLGATNGLRSTWLPWILAATLFVPAEAIAVTLPNGIPTPFVAVAFGPPLRGLAVALEIAAFCSFGRRIASRLAEPASKGARARLPGVDEPWPVPELVLREARRIPALLGIAALPLIAALPYLLSVLASGQ